MTGWLIVKANSTLVRAVFLCRRYFLVLFSPPNLAAF